MAESRKAAGPRTKSRAASAAQRVRKHREKLRAAGLKPVQLWVWDTTRPGFAEEIQRQVMLARDHPQEEQILKEIESLADLQGWK